MLGLRFYYFTVPWNMFDFLLLLASIFDILMEDIMIIEFPISPTLLRVIRVFRIGRILRLIKVIFERILKKMRRDIYEHGDSKNFKISPGFRFTEM